MSGRLPVLTVDAGGGQSPAYVIYREPVCSRLMDVLAPMVVGTAHERNFNRLKRVRHACTAVSATIKPDSPLA
jgi:hypothetical protein